MRLASTIISSALILTAQFTFAVSNTKIEINDQGAQALRLIVDHCKDQISELAVNGISVGKIEQTGSVRSNDFSLELELARNMGEYSEVAGRLKLKATPIKNPMMGGLSFETSCSVEK